MLSIYREESPLATEVRRIANKLRIAGTEKGIKSVMVTSAALGEGKSTAAAYLAIACSQYRNMQTVLVDFDLRRPRVHELFGLRRQRGIAEILSKRSPIKAYLKGTRYPNLRVVTSGRDSHKNPSELLNSSHMEELFAELRFCFDLIIIDTPPVIPVSDPLLLSPELDGALFVVKAGKTQKPVIQRGLELLKDARVETLGVLLNNMHNVLPYYYDHSYYHYQYSSETEDLE